MTTASPVDHGFHDSNAPTPPSRHLVLLGVYTTLLIAMPLLHSVGELSDTARDWIGVARYAVLTAVGIWACKDAFTRSARGFLAHPVRCLVVLVGTMLAAAALPMLPAVLLQVAGWVPTTATNDDAVARMTENVGPLVYIVTLAVLGPITEELVFRETLIGHAPRGVPTWCALLVSSLLFGLLHVHSIAELPLALVYGAAGFAFGLGYLASRRNIMVAIAAHGVTNGVPALGMLV